MVFKILKLPSVTALNLDSALLMSARRRLVEKISRYLRKLGGVQLRFGDWNVVVPGTERQHQAEAHASV